MHFECDGPDSVMNGVVNKMFDQLLHSKMVVLEKYQVECNKESHEIKGVVAVMNTKPVKNIFVRYTENDWENFVDVAAKSVSSCCTNYGTNFNRFEFKLPFNVSETMITGDSALDRPDWSCSVEFAIAYQVDTVEYWDNNDGWNYKIKIRNTVHEN